MPDPALRLSRAWSPRGLPFEHWLVPTLAAAVGAAVLAGAPAELPVRRGLVFVVGPLWLLAGLAPRLHEYLHAPTRLRLLPLPIGGDAHWRASGPRHRQGLAISAVLGALAIAVTHIGPFGAAATTWGLVADWLWLCGIAALLEPWAPALAAWLGRRQPAGGWARDVQTRLGGGWTLPEATAHLYVPPLVLGATAALAMPGQLLFDRFVDDAAIPEALGAVTLASVAIAVLARPLAPRAYRAAVFEAVGWLAQATRTLAGPPIAAAVPGLVARTRDPALRLFALQLWRTTPVPALRLWGLLGVAAWIGLVAGLTWPRVGVVVALCTAWVVPGLRVLVGGALGRAAVFAGRPGPSPERCSRPPGAWVWLLGPVAIAAALCWLGVGRGA